MQAMEAALRELERAKTSPGSHRFITDDEIELLRIFARRADYEDYGSQSLGRRVVAPDLGTVMQLASLTGTMAQVSGFVTGYNGEPRYGEDALLEPRNAVILHAGPQHTYVTNTADMGPVMVNLYDGSNIFMGRLGEVGLRFAIPEAPIE